MALVSNLGKIPYQDLQRMHNHYLNNKRKVLSPPDGEPETKSIWFENHDEFKTLLRDILDPNNEVSGIRVYICQHDQESIELIDSPNKSQYLNKLTVGFVPTKAISDAQHVDHPEAVNNTYGLAAYDQGKICPPDICP